MSTTAQPTESRIETAPILDGLLLIEAEAQRILRMRGVRGQYPNACDKLDWVLNFNSKAYVKFNEGDDKD